MMVWGDQDVGIQESSKIFLQRMNGEEYSEFYQILGHKVIKIQGMEWCRIRPFFFRPLLPFREYAPESICAPLASLIGGVQVALTDGVPANSFMNFRMFNDASDYSLKSLDSNRRRQVKVASEHFVMRPMEEVNEFKKQAYPVYLSFYERTHYQTGATRRYEGNFSKWADALFRIPKIIVLGGYQGNQLRGISVSMCVEEMGIYAAFFCDTESLQWHFPDLMLHSVREMVADHPDIVQLFAGMWTGNRGLDDFYALRGCQLVKKPARLSLNPLVKVGLKFGMPNLYAKIIGK